MSLVRRRRLRSSSDGVRSRYLDESFYMLKTQSVPVTNAVSMVEHFTWYGSPRVFNCFKSLCTLVQTLQIITASRVISNWMAERVCLSPQCDVLTWSRVSWCRFVPCGWRRTPKGDCQVGHSLIYPSTHFITYL